MNLKELKAMRIGELTEIAKKMNVDGAAASRSRNSSSPSSSPRRPGGDRLRRGYARGAPDGYGFLRAPTRTTCGADDIYVSPPRSAASDCAPATPSAPDPGAQGDERYFALLKVEKINYEDPRSARTRSLRQPDALYRRKSSRWSTSRTTTPPGSSTCGADRKGSVPSSLAARREDDHPAEHRQRLTKNHPRWSSSCCSSTSGRGGDGHAAQRQGRGHILTFDEPAQRHVQVAEMVLEKAKRLVEHKKDVVILLDSITRWRGVQRRRAAVGKVLSGGWTPTPPEAEAVLRRARNIEEGGSLRSSPPPHRDGAGWTR